MGRIDVRITNNSTAVLRELSEKVEAALIACGHEAERYAKKNSPVDTGRLKNSITFVTNKFQSDANTSGRENAKADDYKPKATPENNAVYIGTNVEYAEVQEFGSYNHTVGKQHFLRDSVAQHQDKYKAIIKAALE